jgi:phosphatidylserine/phosphatidylglycerophosphate/cardiolipin synthase-like enzyme
VYVHSKVAIVDDCVAFIGSANINDRSLLADTDSELCVRVSHGVPVTVYMNGVPTQCSAFVHRLRQRLWREHLGLLDSPHVDVSDPVCDAVYNLLWRARAAHNTLFYERVFPATRRWTAMYTDEELAAVAVPDPPHGFVVSFAAQYGKGADLLTSPLRMLAKAVFL